MHVFVTDPASDSVLMTRELHAEEILDPIIYAREWADANGVEIDEDDKGYIPDCSGHIRVELREDPANTVHIWSACNYFTKGEDE
jgi:hypothetical protein